MLGLAIFTYMEARRAKREYEKAKRIVHFLNDLLEKYPFSFDSGIGSRRETQEIENLDYQNFYHS